MILKSPEPDRVFGERHSRKKTQSLSDADPDHIHGVRLVAERRSDQSREQAIAPVSGFLMPKAPGNAV